MDSLPPRTLYIGNHTYSSWSLRPWLFLKHFGVAFESIRLPLYVPEAVERLNEVSPSKQVPCLVDGDLKVWDSLAIIEYANETYELSGLPADRGARAICRSVSAEMHSGFSHLRRTLPMNCRRVYDSFPVPAEADKDIARVQAIWTELRAAHAAEGPYLFGQFTMADAMFAPVVLRFATYKVAAQSPAAAAYMEAIQAHPAVQEWCALAGEEPEKLNQYEY
eukprot:m.35098 g.35098  ORF g.35098 m.35098 type:complete len:221 (+) comp5296_c0_seq1:30-692(+)